MEQRSKMRGTDVILVNTRNDVFDFGKQGNDLLHENKGTCIHPHGRVTILMYIKWRNGMVISTKASYLLIDVVQKCFHSNITQICFTEFNLTSKNKLVL